MCLALPARVSEVVEAGRGLVRVEVAGSSRVVDARLLDPLPEPGDWLVVHAGFALEAISPEEAEEALGSWREGTAT